MRIAILTFHRAYNCGAMLQAWALKTVLERMGHKVEFPICNHVGEEARWKYGWVNRDKRGIQFLRSLLGRFLLNALSVPCEDILRMRYRHFRKVHLPERVCSPGSFSKYYDLVVVGSDQVWSVKHAMSEAPLFFAENIPACVRKIVYAASYGDRPLNDDAIIILNRWHERTGEHRFVFGLLEDSFNLQDKEERKRMRLNKNRAIKTSLATIGEKMELPFNLSMHVARHTFAVLALNKGVDVHIISRLMAHSSVSVTEQIYAKFLPSTLEKEVQSKLNFNFLNG